MNMKKSGVSKPVFYWKKQLLDSPPGQKIYRHYLFDQTGALQGYIQDTKDGLYKGYAGRPGELLGVFDTLDEAKDTIVYCLTGENNHYA